MREPAWAIAIAVTMIGGCSSLQPEVGERLEACVDEDSDKATSVDFKTQIRPIIEARCSSCHYYGRGTAVG